MHAWPAFLLITGAYASSQFSTISVHESTSSVPYGFTLVSPASVNQTLNLRIALANSNITGLEEMLYAVSTPSSPLYGQYLSKEEVEEYVRPTNETTSIVNDFFRVNNISTKTISPAGDWLAFSIPVSQANDLFGANYSIFKHEATGSQITRTLSYSIPVELQGHLELLHPSISFDIPVNQSPVNATRISSPSTPQNVKSSSLETRQNTGDACGGSSSGTPTCWQALYGIPTTHATQSTNHIGVIGLNNEVASTSDFQLYLSNFRPDLTGFTFNVLSVDGGINSQQSVTLSDSGDAYAQITAGLASKVPLTYIIVGSETSDGPLDGMLDTANVLLAQDAPPQVLSLGYSLNEDTISSALASQLCNAFMQLGAQGVSVITASGNGGVSGAVEQSEDCAVFVPTFPSGCPFVTSVGATEFVPELAHPDSSGGFSNIFSRPSYQSSAVAEYLTHIGSENAGLFNPSGRGFPDVSASGTLAFFFLGSGLGFITGSDISASVFASVIALLNDGLISQGKPVMGFLNPFLYSVASEVPILNDITSGNNAACGLNGFDAMSGWDPVTGLGTPNFPSLKGFVGS